MNVLPKPGVLPVGALEFRNVSLDAGQEHLDRNRHEDHAHQPLDGNHYPGVDAGAKFAAQ
jgi:hypothetical protein